MLLIKELSPMLFLQILRFLVNLRLESAFFVGFIKPTPLLITGDFDANRGATTLES